MKFVMAFLLNFQAHGVSGKF